MTPAPACQPRVMETRTRANDQENEQADKIRAQSGSALLFLGLHRPCRASWLVWAWQHVLVHCLTHRLLVCGAASASLRDVGIELVPLDLPGPGNPWLVSLMAGLHLSLQTSLATRGGSVHLATSIGLRLLCGGSGRWLVRVRHGE